MEWHDDEARERVSDVAPLADPNERVILRVPIGKRPEAPRVTIPRLDPPAENAQESEGSDRPTWPPTSEGLERLVSEGLTNREIAERYGVAVVTVAKKLQQWGIRRDPEARAAVLSRAGRKGREAGGKRHPMFEPKPAGDATDTAPQDTPAPAGRRDPLDEFGAILAQAIRQVREIGLDVDVEIRLRIGGAA